MKLSVIYSFYNEEENIPEVIRRTLKAIYEMDLKRGEYEIIFVNDRSTDRSAELILEARQIHPEIKMVTTTRKFGNAEGILAGFSFSTGERVAYLDTDLQDPPELITKLYNLSVAKSVDIVHTRRTRRHGEHPLYLLTAKLGYAILGYTMNVPMRPNVGDFKLITRRVVEAVLRMNEPLPFMRGMISYVGFSEHIVEYEREPRHGGQTHFPVIGRRVISNFINNALIGYSDLPIYIILWASGLGMLLAFGLAAYAVITKITGSAVPGSAGMILVVTAFGSMTLFSLGIIGLYLVSIKKAVLRRPMYLVDQTEGFAEEHAQVTPISSSRGPR